MPLARDAIDTPALLIDLDALEGNVALMAGRARGWGVGLRPHAKTHKCVEIARRQVAAGALGVTCATIDEAEAMVEAGIPGVLVSSPLVTQGKVARLMRLRSLREDVMVVADHADNVQALAQAASEAGVVLGVLVDVDVGHHRTGVQTPQAGAALARAIQAAPGLRFAGLQGYAGHLQHIVGFEERRAAAEAAAATLAGLRDLLSAEGLAPAIVTGAGTGTAAIDGPGGVFTELQAGSYIFMDAEYGEVALDPAAPSPFAVSLFLQTSVVSMQAGHVTTDAGTKSFAVNGPPPRIARGAPASSAYGYQGDEHGRVDMHPGETAPRLGARIECVVSHCDPTVALHDRFILVRGEEVLGTWAIDARGRRAG